MGSNDTGEPTKFDPNFKGPLKNRSCTDIIFLILFIVGVVGMGFVAVLAFVRGDPTKLIYPTDSNGNICGTGNYASRPYLFYFSLLDCATVGPSVLVTGCPTPTVCIEKCPTITFVYSVQQAKEASKISTASGRTNFICIDGFDPLTSSLSVQDIITQEKCAAFYIPSSSKVQRCLPYFLDSATSSLNVTALNLKDKLDKPITTASLTDGAFFLNQLIQGLNYVMKAVDDVRSVWWLLLAMLVLAALVSFIWIVIMRWISGIMVWVSLISFTIVFAFATYYCFNEYVILLNKVATPAFSVGTDYKAYANYKETWLVAGIICAIFLIIMLILVIFLRNRIKIAVSIIKETSRAIGSMMFTLIFPIFPFIFEILALGFWIVSAMYIQTMGSPQFTESPLQVTTDASLKLTETVGSLTAAVPCDPTGSSTSGKLCNFLKYGGDEYIYILQIYQLFMFLWVLNFIIAFGQMTLAGAFSGYYWAFNKPKDIPTFPLLGSAWRAFRYHIGTMAFGALIIAIIQMIRIFLEYLDQKLKSLTNPVARFIMCCLKCCFWCLEKFMKFINKNAYIMCAIYGKNFCVSAKNAFFLIIRNILRVVVVDKVTDFVLFISKIVVTAGMTTLAYFLFNGQLFDLNLLIAGIFLNYFFIPVIIVAIGTFIVASLFFSVYSMGVDTLFLCFLEDLERHDGSTEKPYYMSVELMDIVGKKNKPEKKK